jgi:hypothetical protein
VLKLFSSGRRISGASGLPPGDAAALDVAVAGGAAGGRGGVGAAGVELEGLPLRVMAGGAESNDAVCSTGDAERAGLLLNALGAGTRTGADCGCTAGAAVGVVCVVRATAEIGSCPLLC